MNHDRIVLLIDRYARSLSGKDLAAFADLLDREAHRVRCLANAESLRGFVPRGPGRDFLEKESG